MKRIRRKEKKRIVAVLLQDKKKISSSGHAARGQRPKQARLKTSQR
jgi:hypothetical protein